MRRKIDVWRVNLSAAPRLDACRLSALREDERLRLGGYLSPGPARRFALTRIALRHILAQSGGGAAAGILLGEDARGKPRRVDGGGGSFNVAHSGDHALIAISNTLEVGVDIEGAAARGAHARLARTVCSPAERAWLTAHPDEADEAFNRLWTRKEALLKAVGVGLRTPPARVDLGTQMTAAEGATELPGAAAGGSTRCLWRAVPAAPGFQATVAAVVPPRLEALEVTVHEFPAEALAL